jgi:prevent-host-death family protein
MALVASLRDITATLAGAVGEVLLDRSLSIPVGLFPSTSLNVAVLLAMSLSEQLSLADVKNHLSEVIDRVERQHGWVVITKDGRPAAVLLSVEDLESLEETLEVMRDPGLLDAVREAEAEVATGSTEPLTEDEALSLIKPL